MIELQEMQLKAFEELEKRQHQFFEQIIEVRRKEDAPVKEKGRQFFME